MGTNKSIGILECKTFAHSVYLIDCALKTSDVEVISTEKLLGGQLVTVVFEGSYSQVNVAVESAREHSERLGENVLVASFVISNPHDEIMKFIKKENINALNQ